MGKSKPLKHNEVDAQIGDLLISLLLHLAGSDEDLGHFHGFSITVVFLFITNSVVMLFNRCHNQDFNLSPEKQNVAAGGSLPPHLGYLPPG